MKEQKLKNKFKKFGNFNIRVKNDGTCNDIAIVGMACRFPGANNYQEFWTNLEEGVSSIQEINRWNFDEHYSPNRDDNKSISKWCGLLDNIDKFDNDFFNISPREASQMDPQQRILLEETWHCVEDAGIALKRLQEKRTSVYVGAMALDSYKKFSSEADIDIYSASGIYQFMLANRLSYYFGLTGESIVVEAACASSMVALCNAKKALTAGECDYSIVAGINLHFSPLGYLMWSKNRMLSGEGKCKTFDKDANGFVSGEGIGVVLLQPLDKAIQEKNHIYGVIRGAAVNHGGKAVSISAPRVEAQKDVILAAYEDAGFDPETVSYVEAHGTGTSLGDPIEIEALTKAFRTTTTQKQFCKIGSVKTNIGHLIAAAGLSGVIKVLMMMQHNKIPPSLNVQKINPIIDFANSPFSIADSLTEWTIPKVGMPLRAGVSSFGFGGVNCHVLLEKYIEPIVKADDDAKIAYPFVLSAKNIHSLKAAVQGWRNFTKSNSDDNWKIEDVCLTMLTGRAEFPYRCGKLIKNKEELLMFLENSEIDIAKNTTDVSWGLRIGELVWGDIDVKLITREIPLFKEKINQVLEYLDEYDAEQQIRKSFFRKNRSKQFDTLYSFILNYAYISTLIELGLSLDMVSGLKNGLWCSLAISGAVKLQDVLAVLCGQKDLGKVKVTCPTIPFFDQVNQQVLSKYSIDEVYVNNLLDVDIPDRIVLHYLEKTRSLLSNQFTFIKYLEEWDSKLNLIGLNVREIIQDNEFLATNNEFLAKRKLLLMIIMLSSFSRLNHKWNLSEEKLVSDERFYELLDLVLDQVICKEDLIFLLGSQRSDLAAIIAVLNARQNRISTKKRYKYLHEHSKNSLAILDMKTWFTQQFALDQISALPELICLDFGQMGMSSQTDNTITFTATQDISTDVKKLLVALWTKGVDIRWNQLYPENSFTKCALPVYSFNHNSFWLSDNENLFEKKNEGISRLSQASIHPLLQENTSNLSEQRFSSTFTGQEFFLADHIVKGKKVLPGVAYLEMARAAIEKAAGNLAESKAQLCIKNIVWSRPIKVDDCSVKVNIGLYPEDNGVIAYEVYSQEEAADAKAVIHSQGIVVMNPAKFRPTLDIKKLQADCSRSVPAEKIYQAYSVMGLKYGPGHRGIKMVYVGKNQVLAKLALPSSVTGTKEQFVLHPSLLDSALQASLGLIIKDGTTVGKLALPFALKELEIFEKCSSAMWARIGYSDGSKAGDKVQKLDIDLCDETGKVCVRFKEFSSRVLEGEIGSTSTQEEVGTLNVMPCWREEAVDQMEDTVLEYDQHVIVLCEPKGITPEIIEKEMNNVECLVLKSEQQGIAERFHSYAIQLFEKVKNLLTEKNKGNILVQVVGLTHKEQQFFFGLSGLLKTAHLENQKVIGQLIGIERWEEISGIIEKLQENSQRFGDSQIRYERGKRWVVGWDELRDDREDIIPWKKEGVYLVTGGVGGLGRIFAKDIAQKVKNPTLILLGRSALGEEEIKKLEKLESLGARIEYKSVDVSRKEAVVEAIQSIKEQYGKLNGIIHGAGIIKDNFIIRKTKKEFSEVLSPKVTGLVNLDQASKEEELDFFIVFSSIAGGLGNIGQADYAAANAFMDVYAKYRNALVAAKERKGRTLSINWPLWKEGGMTVDAQTENMLMQSMGMIPMGTTRGIEALYHGLSSDLDQMLVMEGKLERMKQKLLSKDFSVRQVKVEQPEFDFNSKVNKVQELLQQMTTELLKVNIENIDVNEELGEYGFDSITFTEFANQLNQEYQLELAPTIFFEYPTLSSLAAYLVEEHQSAFAPQFVNKAKLDALAGEHEELLFSNRSNVRFMRTIAASTERSLQTSNSISEPIAIVGMSAVFPMAKDVKQYWENLEEGRDCITEVPRDRWDWKKYYGDSEQAVNKTNSKWGGFIDSIAEFDPLFFGISPREAELMDPQQRLMMTYVWKTIEDAGYSAQNLSGKNIGLFIGTMDTGYSRLLAKYNIPIEGYTSTGRVASVGPNRISYFLDFHGPSEPIETACSSALTAIHRAIGVIESGQCEMAIAGAVNTMPSPEYHISFSKAGMLSPDGRCKTFSANANGYVRGEGAGMIFLKKLKDAEQAGDHIYGIIRGSAENHGGHANSLTAPNPKAQAEVLKAAYMKAGIDPRTVTYIEAHGTGTKLGDPIEINGLKSAFKDLYEMTGDSQVVSRHCGLGSVKTNIGHLELAAGIAGVIKILLQLKHKTLVKSLHCDSINPYIQLEDSPFYLVRENMEWKALKDEQGQDIPRRAGVSSFGFGGANVHVVIEEYIPHKQQNSIIDRHPALIVLSAQNNNSLMEQARQLLAFIQNQKLSAAGLIDVAYTLQVGRDAMEERLAMLVGSSKELEQKLQGFLQDAAGISDMYRGQAKYKKEKTANFDQKNMAGTVISSMSKEEIAKLLEAWVNGYNFDWNQLYDDFKPNRVSLPTYPFSKERYWISNVNQEMTVPLTSQGKFRFDKEFIEKLLDEVMDDVISIDSAVQKTKAKGLL